MANFRLAIETTLFAHLPLGEALQKSSECGFGMVEVGLSHFDACAARTADVEGLDELLTLNGLGVVALFALPVGSTQADKVEPWDLFPGRGPARKGRRADEARARVAVKMGVQVPRLGAQRGHGRPSASRRSFVKSIGELLPELHDDGVRIFFEAHPGDFVEDSFDAVDLLRSFRSRHVGYNYCVPHTFNLGHRPRDIVRNAEGLLGYAHFAETLMPSRIFFSPTHPPKVKPHLHMIPGQGDVDMGEVISSLADVGFDGYLAAQPFSNSDEPVKAAKRTRASMVRMIAGLDKGSRAGR